MLTALQPAAAQDAYPSRPIRIVVPFTSGASTDTLARLIGAQLSPIYNQPVVVDNRPGAGGHIGAELVAKSPPDGYTLLLGTIGIHAAYAIYKSLPYDPGKDLQPITVLTEFPNVVIVHPSVPAKTLTEFVALAKAKPGEINFGSAGTGSSTHMIGELFKIAAGVNLTHVPYRGSAPALNDVVAGQIQSMFENIPTVPPLVKSGAVRALAVTSSKRSPALPDVPTPAEAGVPNYEATAWFTLAAPAGVPKPIIDKLYADVAKVLAMPAVVTSLREAGATTVGNPPDQTAAFFAAERTKWTHVIKTANITGE